MAHCIFKKLKGFDLTTLEITPDKTSDGFMLKDIKTAISSKGFIAEIYGILKRYKLTHYKLTKILNNKCVVNDFYNALNQLIAIYCQQEYRDYKEITKKINNYNETNPQFSLYATVIDDIIIANVYIRDIQIVYFEIEITKGLSYIYVLKSLITVINRIHVDLRDMPIYDYIDLYKKNRYEYYYVHLKKIMFCLLKRISLKSKKSKVLEYLIFLKEMLNFNVFKSLKYKILRKEPQIFI